MKAPHKILWIRTILCFLTGGFFFEGYPYCFICGHREHFTHTHEK